MHQLCSYQSPLKSEQTYVTTEAAGLAYIISTAQIYLWLIKQLQHPSPPRQLFIKSSAILSARLPALLHHSFTTAVTYIPCAYRARLILLLQRTVNATLDSVLAPHTNLPPSTMKATCHTIAQSQHESSTRTCVASKPHRSHCSCRESRGRFRQAPRPQVAAGFAW